MIAEKVGKGVPFSSQTGTLTLSSTIAHTSTVSLSYEIDIMHSCDRMDQGFSLHFHVL